VTLSYSHSCEVTSWWIEYYHLAHRLSTASKYFSNLAWSWPPSASPNSLDHCLQFYHQTGSIISSMFARSWPWSTSPNSIDYGLPVRMIVACKCISKLARLQSPSSHERGLQMHLQTQSIRNPEWISKFTRSGPRSVSLNTLDRCLIVYLWVHFIVVFMRTSNCSQAPPAAGPGIPCVDA